MVEVYSSRELREGEGKEIGMVLPFEVAAEDSQSLLSLTREMEHLLDPLNKLRTPPPSVDLSPLECHALQTEEVETLTAIYGSDLRTLNDQGTCFSVNVRFLSQDVVQDDDVIKIWFSLPASYPSVPPVFEIETNTSGSFNYRDADDLFDLLMRESVRRVGNIMIFDIVSIAQDYMPGLIETKREVGKRREKEERERMGRLQLEEALETRNKKTGIPGEIWDVLLPENQSAEKTEREEGDEEGDEIVAGRLPSGGGAVSDDVTFGPAHFVGSISNILSKFPDGLQINRIENILRQDLARRFHRCRETMTSVLADSERKNPHMYDVQTHVAFHGTLTRSFPSIVERGLVIPGSGNSVKVRCGSSLGVGIYLSPSPTFSLSFTDSNRLIVCAALLGRVYRHGSIFTGRFHSSFNSLVCGEEWVFFNAAQVLPCYVVELREVAKSSQTSRPPPLSSLLDHTLSSSSSSARSEETSEQRKARFAARARKFLPYGFGPGAQTVILDVGSVDDDEEDYGDYQLLRNSGGQEVDAATGGPVKKSSELQEYRYTTPSGKR